MKASVALIAFCAAALAMPVAANAKGPSEAFVTGPGIGTLKLGGGEVEGSPVTQLALSAGFFPSAFRQSPDPILQTRPRGPLGPRYTIRYVVPVGEGKRDEITQDAYPYARPAAVAHMAAGQAIFDGTTRGGWYPGGPQLKHVLVSAGLPKVAPRVRHRSRNALWVLLGVGLPAAALIPIWRRRK